MHARMPTPNAGAPPDAPEVPDAGWNADADSYALLYRPDAPITAAATATSSAAPKTSGPLLLLKALVMGPTLLVSLAAGAEGAEPAVVDLSTAQYYDGGSAAASAAQRYQRLDELVARINGALSSIGSGTAQGKAAAAAAGPAAAKAAGAGNPSSSSAEQQQQQQQRRREQQQQRRHPDDDPLRIGPPRQGGRLYMPGECMLGGVRLVVELRAATGCSPVVARCPL